MQSLAKYNKLILLLIPVISFAMHYKVMQLDLIGIHVWRQTQTQTVINNFAYDDFNILHPKYNTNPDTDRIMRMEFPLMQWLFAIFFKLFGYHIFISRVLSFIIGIASVFGIYRLLKNIFHNVVIALIGAWAFNFSPEFYYYTINPLPDNFAFCCAIWSAALFFKWVQDRSGYLLVMSLLFLSLGSLVKLPFILYGSLPAAYFVMAFMRKELSVRVSIFTLACFIAALLPPIIWYASVIPTWQGNGIVKGIADNKLSLAEILYILQSNFISTLPELLINYCSVPFFVAGFWFVIKNKIFRTPYFPVFAIWGSSILVYFFFELNMISDVHDYYLFPFLPLIFILVAYGAYNLILSVKSSVRYVTMLLLLLLPLTAFLRTVSRWNTESPMVNIDLYRNKDELRKLVSNNDYCVVGNDKSNFIFLYYIDKKGWVFDDNYITADMLKAYISKGAKYLFIDTPIDTVPAIKEHLGAKIFDKNSLRVYQLKSDSRP